MMSFIDVGIIVLVLLSSIIGIFRGFVREVLSLVAWAAAFYIALKFHGKLSIHLDMISPETLRDGVAFLAVFFLVLIAFSLFNYVIAKLVDGTGLSGTDRTLGVVFGVARGGAIVLTLVVLAGLTPLPESKVWSSSFLIPHFQQAGQVLKGYLPENFAQYLDVSVITGSKANAAEPVAQEEIIQSEAIIVEGK